MIHGIGTDIVLEKRIAALYKKHGRAFAERVLHPAELPEFEAAARPTALLAKRFAAKEAAAKAIGTGIRGAVSFRNIGISHNAKGKHQRRQRHRNRLRRGRKISFQTASTLMQGVSPQGDARGLWGAAET